MINDLDITQWAYLLNPTFQFVNTAGKPLTQGYLEVYIHGTRDKYYCASDFNGTLLPFQIPLDSLGSNIVLADPKEAYDVYVYNKYGSLIMSRYNVKPINGGSGESTLNIIIESSDGTVNVTNVSGGAFDLSISDAISRIEALEEIIDENTGITAYSIAHSDSTDNGYFALTNDSRNNLEYTSDGFGWRLASNHIYQINFNAEFDCGVHDQYVGGTLYLEGPASINQTWTFNVDDSYNHDESFVGSSVLVTPANLDYYDLKLRFNWNEDYTNKPGIKLNKVSIVDITSIINQASIYSAGDGINITNQEISVDMNYINNNISASGYATQTQVYNATVTAINAATAVVPTVDQSDWTETNVSAQSYIKNKPNELTLVAGDNIDITINNNDIIISASATPTSGFATRSELNTVSATLESYVDTSMVSAINVATGVVPTVEQSDWDESDPSDQAYIKNKPDLIQVEPGQNIGIFVDETTNTVTIAASGSDLSDYVTTSTMSSISGTLQTEIETVSSNIPDVSNFATKSQVASVSSVLENEIQTVSAAIPDVSNLATKQEVQDVEADVQIVSAAIPDVSNLATKSEVQSVADDVQVVSAAIPSLNGYATEQWVENKDYANNTDLQIVSAAIPSLNGYATESYVDTSIVSAINVATGVIPSQEQSNWNETNTSSPAYIQNKPDLSVYATNSDLQVVSAAIPDINGLATKQEVNTVSGVLESEIQIVSGAIPDTSDMATKTWVGQQGYLTSIPSEYVTDSELATVSGVLQNEIDSIVVTGGSGIIYQAGDHIDITDDTISVTGITELVAGNAITITTSGASAIISSTGEAQVQSDWNVTDSSSKAYIRNKPTIPAAQIQSDWNQTNTSSKDYIKNKPSIPNYSAASGITITSNVISLDNPIGLVAGSGINIVVESDSAIICVSGVTGGGGSGTTYTGGNCISISNNTIGWTTTLGIIDIVSAASAVPNPDPHILYLIPES